MAYNRAKRRGIRELLVDILEPEHVRRCRLADTIAGAIIDLPIDRWPHWLNKARQRDLRLAALVDAGLKERLRCGRL